MSNRVEPASDYVDMTESGSTPLKRPAGGPRLVGSGSESAPSTPPSELSDGGGVIAGPSRLPHPSIAVVSGPPEPTPAQLRCRKVSTYVLITIYVCIMVMLGLAIWQLIVAPRERHVVAWGIAAFFVALAVPLSLNDILLHMNHYVRPDLQKYYIRVLFMVPIYAVESWLALRFKDQKVYLETAREAYEAFVIYSFFSMMLSFCGGPDYLKRLMLEKAAVTGHSTSKMLPPFCWLRGWRLTTGQFVNRCRFGVFQYVFLRTLLAMLALILEKEELYGEGEWRNYAAPFPYFVVVLNLSQVWAMYCLVLFYHEAAEILQPLKPFPKFLVVKAVVFFSFWQGIIISGLSYAKVIQPTLDYTQEDVAKGLQDFLICIEMALAAVAHRYMFSYHDFYREARLLHRPSGYASFAGDGGSGAAPSSTSSSAGGGFSTPPRGGAQASFQFAAAASMTTGGTSDSAPLGSAGRVVRHHGAWRAAQDLLPIDVVLDAKDHLSRGIGAIAAGAKQMPLIGRGRKRGKSVGSDAGDGDAESASTITDGAGSSSSSSSSIAVDVTAATASVATPAASISGGQSPASTPKR